MSQKCQPFVSVVIAIYNAMPYLEECLDSVCGQTLEDIEILLVDDASMDGSLRLMERYAEKDGRIRLIRKERNTGKADSCNVGIDQATGRYLCIPDADDILSERMLERLYARAETTGAEIVKCSFFNFVEDRKCVSLTQVPPMSGSPLDGEDKSFFFFVPVVWNGLYRRDFLNEKGLRLGGGRSHDDVAFHFMMAVAAGHIETVDEPLYFYRTDNPQSISRCISDYRSVFKSLDYVEQSLKPFDEGLESLYYRYRFGHMTYGYRKVVPASQKAYFNEMRQRLMDINGDAVERYFSSRDKKKLKTLVDGSYWKWRIRGACQRLSERRRSFLSVRIGCRGIRVSVLNRLIVNRDFFQDA